MRSSIGAANDTSKDSSKKSTRVATDVRVFALAPVLVAVLSACGQDAGLESATGTGSPNPGVTQPAGASPPANPPGMIAPSEAAVLPDAFPAVIAMDAEGFQKQLTATEYIKRLAGDAAAEVRTPGQMLLAADFYTTSTPPLADGQIELTTLSTLPDTVSNGDVLVALRGVKTETFKVQTRKQGDSVDTDQTAVFKRQANGEQKWLGKTEQVG